MDPQPAPHPFAAIDAEDLRVFHDLVAQVTHDSTLNSLLDTIASHLGTAALSIAAPGTAPARDGTVVTPVHHLGRHLCELVAQPADGDDSARLATRLATFAPVVALHLALHPAIEDPAVDAEEAVYDERDRLEAVLEATNDAILLIDTHDTLVMATLQFELFTGISRYDVLGAPIGALVERLTAAPGLPPAMANVVQALTGNFTESLGGEFEVTEPQRRILVWYSLPVYIRSGTLLGRIFAFRDATREREVDRMKSEFVTLVSHELRTPLTSVKGFSDLILESDLDEMSEESREYVSIIAMNVDRLIALINDIIDISRIDTERIELRPEVCDLRSVIAQAAATLKEQLHKHGHRLAVDVPEDLPPTWADPTRLVQVLTNLLSNAIKYTLAPDEIVIAAQTVRGRDALPDAAPRDQIFPCVVISVRDRGVGIAPGEGDKLFQRFYRIEDDSCKGIAGTGLGLAIARSLVEMHGGRMWFESEYGVGSTFSFSVPLARDSGATPF